MKGPEKTAGLADTYEREGLALRQMDEAARLLEFFRASIVPQDGLTETHSLQYLRVSVDSWLAIHQQFAQAMADRAGVKL